MASAVEALNGVEENCARVNHLRNTIKTLGVLSLRINVGQHVRKTEITRHFIEKTVSLSARD